MRFLFPPFLSGKAAVGLLLLRLVVGAAFVLHGWHKIQHPDGPTGWMGPNPTVPAALLAVAAFSEFVGGFALIAGIFTPLAAAALIGVMIGALRHHLMAHDPFVSPGGPSWELAGVYLAVNILLLFVGPGILSVDAALFGRGPAKPVQP